MAGFLFGGALVGLGAFAWPLYLHLRRRRQQIQEIPSLRLFAQVQRLNRRLQMQQVLLLISRLALLLAVVLIVSQPYVQTARSLPLPLAAGLQPPEAELGILIDDSLSALHGNAEVTRLALSREWLSRQVAAMPPTTRFRLTSTTSAFPSVAMSREDALAAIAAYRVLPRRGDAALATQRLAEALAGQRGALILATSRSADLWADDPQKDLPLPLPVHIFDTSTIQADVYLHTVVADQGGVARAELRGQGERMSGQELTLLWDETQARRQTITPHDALRRWAAVALPETSPDAPMQLAVVAEWEHPWLSYWFRAGQRSAGVESAVILRREHPAEIMADKLMTAILQAGFPGLPILHEDAATVEISRLPPASMVICLGLEPDARLHGWLHERLDDGGTVLCLPVVDGEAVLTGNPAPAWYPRWQRAAAKVRLAEALPLQLLTPERVLVPGLEDLLLAGLAEMPVDQRVPMREEMPTFEPLLTTKGGAALVQLSTQGRGKVVAVQMPLTLHADSPAYHPLFPLFIAGLLRAAQGGEQTVVDAWVGESVSLADWFSRQRLSGELVTPSGQVVAVNASMDKPQYLPIEVPGRYRLEVQGESLSRGANYPRESRSEVLTREVWQRQRPNTRAIWYDSPHLIDEAALTRLGEPGGSNEPRRYDLSPVAALLVLVALLLEGLMLWRIWQPLGARHE